MTNVVLPAWARWNEAARKRPYSIGIEEEVMLIDPASLNLASRVDDVLAVADGTELATHLAQETHGSAVELRTDPHDDVEGALAQLGRLREALRATLASIGLVPAAAGTHPFALWRDVHVSAGARQQELLGTMRELARREPTFALHVHVGVADPEDAVRAMNRMRTYVPLLLALSANSPFWQGRDSGLASARTPLFGAFPRSGLPRAFEDYAAMVEATDTLIRCGAIREPSFIWWDVRLQPRYGTVEVRVMDAQTDPAHTAALVGLVREVVAMEDEGFVPVQEVLEENRFRALRDGVDATFIDQETGDLVPVADMLAACPPVPGVDVLLDQPGARRQRERARGERGLIGLVQDLVERF